MINLYGFSGTKLAQRPKGPFDRKSAELTWIDLLEPTANEISNVETALAISLPTRAQMIDIEPSDRLYIDNENLFLTFTMLDAAQSKSPKRAFVTLVLVDEKLVTLRYADPLPFKRLIEELPETHFHRADGSAVASKLLENIIDRLADVLEHIATKFEETSAEIFLSDGDSHVSHDFRRLLRELGMQGELLSKCRESLASISRLAGFVIGLPEYREGHANRRLRSIERDAKVLSEYAEFVDNKQSFLLDAILGLINIEQTGIIKIFSVLAIVFLPPTLIASIYGMNFEIMPELDWRLGYPISLVLMILSSILPFYYFKRRGWL